MKETIMKKITPETKQQWQRSVMQKQLWKRSLMKQNNNDKDQSCKNNYEKDHSWKNFLMALPTTPIKTTPDQT